MTDPAHPIEPADPIESGGAPLRPRSGRLALIFVGIVTAGLAAITVLSVGTEPDTSGSVPATVRDPAGIGLGALAGEPAPDLVFELFDGGTFSMAEHVRDDGRPLVLNFWASWCVPCRAEIPEFSEVAVEHETVAFVGVAVDDFPVPAGEFAAQIDASFPLGVDADRAVPAAYPYLGLPTTYLIHEDGTVARQIQGQVSGAQLDAFLEFDFRR